MPNFIDLSGQKFGRLTAIERVCNGKNGTYWKCIYDCGNEKEVLGSSLKNGHTKSCGCYRKEIRVEKNKGDFIGKKFGLLTVLSEERDENNNFMYRCQCDCGNSVLVKGNYLSCGDTKSCGCLKKEALIRKTQDRYNWKKIWKINCIRAY